MISQLCQSEQISTSVLPIMEDVLVPAITLLVATTVCVVLDTVLQQTIMDVMVS